MNKRLTAHFSGMVQGVGFRFTAQSVARQFAVTGYVRNLPNGQVELAAEGEEEVLREFLRAVRESAMSNYIRDVETKWSEAENKYTRFSIAT